MKMNQIQNVSDKITLEAIVQMKYYLQRVVVAMSHSMAYYI